MSGNVTIKKFDMSDEQRWDNFVLTQAYNGTILQTRKFLNYHKEGKFIDNSLLVYKGENRLIAVIPACIVCEDGLKIFSSHSGTTFGGIIIDKDAYSISSVKSILESFEEYIRDNSFDQVILKQASDVFSKINNDLLYYFMFNFGYNHYDELSFCIDFKSMQTDVLGNMKSKTRNEYRFAVKSGLTFKKLDSECQIRDFYDILCKSLMKYDTKPVHTYDELIALKDVNLVNKVEFFGVFKDETMIAGSMVFLFDNVFHTQYLAADSDYLQLKPMNFLDGNLIEEAYNRKFEYFSFGISTEDHGKYLNESLAKFKEGFGTGYFINKTFVKNFQN